MYLRDDNYISIFIDNKKSLFITKWKTASSNIYDTKELKNIICDICDKILTYQPKYYIANQTEKEVPYPVDMQPWIAQKLYKAIRETGVEYVATIQSNNISVSISNEQMIDETKIKKEINIATFNNEQLALKWMNLEN